MSEFAADPVKPRITPAAQERWLEEAKDRLLDGQSLDAVDEFLKGAGCPPRLRQELLARANARSLGPHRAKGLRVLLSGAAVTAVGGAIVWWARTTFVMSMSGHVHHPDKLAFCGVVIVVVGVQMGLVGAWKILSGSRVDISAEVE